MSEDQPNALDLTTTTPAFANMVELTRSPESWVVVLLTKLWKVLRQLLLLALCAVVLLPVLVLLVPILVSLSFKLYHNLLPLYSLLTGDNLTLLQTQLMLGTIFPSFFVQLVLTLFRPLLPH